MSQTNTGHLERIEFSESTPVVPRLSTTLLTARNNSLYELVVQRPQSSTALAGRNVAILTTDGVEETELVIPKRYLSERGAAVSVIAPRASAAPAHFGVLMPAPRESYIVTGRYMEIGGWIKIDKLLEESDPSSFDALFLPGGLWAPDALRANPVAVSFVKAFLEQGKPVAAICHAPWILVETGALRGRRATAYWSIMSDLRNAGATVVDEPVVQDGSLLTSRFPFDFPELLPAFTALLSANRVRAE
jgi:protease I